MSRDKDWDNTFTATELHGIVKGSPSYAGALSFMRRQSRAISLSDTPLTEPGHL